MCHFAQNENWSGYRQCSMIFCTRQKKPADSEGPGRSKVPRQLFPVGALFLRLRHHGDRGHGLSLGKMSLFQNQPPPTKRVRASGGRGGRTRVVDGTSQEEGKKKHHKKGVGGGQGRGLGKGEGRYHSARTLLKTTESGPGNGGGWAMAGDGKTRGGRGNPKRQYTPSVECRTCWAPLHVAVGQWTRSQPHNV